MKAKASQKNFLRTKKKRHPKAQKKNSSNKPKKEQKTKGQATERVTHELKIPFLPIKKKWK
jgi:hypothetical protein